jgi:hypothetical protein
MSAYNTAISFRLPGSDALVAGTMNIPRLEKRYHGGIARGEGNEMAGGGATLSSVNAASPPFAGAPQSALDQPEERVAAANVT